MFIDLHLYQDITNKDYMQHHWKENVSLICKWSGSEKGGWGRGGK